MGQFDLSSEALARFIIKRTRFVSLEQDSIAGPLMCSAGRIHLFLLSKLRGRGDNVVPAASHILPVELKSCHQLLVRGHYTDLGNVERSICRGDQTKGNNHSRKRGYPVPLPSV